MELSCSKVVWAAALSESRAGLLLAAPQLALAGYPSGHDMHGQQWQMPAPHITTVQSSHHSQEHASPGLQLYLYCDCELQDGSGESQYKYTVDPEAVP